MYPPQSSPHVVPGTVAPANFNPIPPSLAHRLPARRRVSARDHIRRAPATNLRHFTLATNVLLHVVWLETLRGAWDPRMPGHWTDSTCRGVLEPAARRPTKSIYPQKHTRHFPDPHAPDADRPRPSRRALNIPYANPMNDPCAHSLPRRELNFFNIHSIICVHSRRQIPAVATLEQGLEVKGWGPFGHARAFSN